MFEAMRRRVLAVLLVALAALGLALWARLHDVKALASGWRPPRLAVPRPVRNSTAAPSTDPGMDWGVVACKADSSENPGRLVAQSEEGGTAISTAEGALLTLNLAAGEWKISWDGRGEGRSSELRSLGSLEVEAGDVHRCTLPEAGWNLSGNVVDGHGEPQPGVVVEGCRAATETDEHGVFVLALQRGDCLVRAWSADGALKRPTDPVYFSPFDPPSSPTFRINTAPIGGVGLALSGANDGLRVNEVLPGGPGEAAGIEAGDVIVEVNGAPTDSWTVPHGVETITGTPGTRVRLRVQRGEAEADHDLVRARIESPAGVADTGGR